jgi:hypothetical protein
MDPIQLLYIQFTIAFRNWLFGTFLQLSKHEVIFLVKYCANQSKIWLYELFVVIGLLHRFLGRKCDHERNLFYQRLYQLYTHLQPMFLRVIKSFTWVGTTEDSSFIFESHDCGSHSLLGIEEIFGLLLLIGCGIVHVIIGKKFKKSLNFS